MAGVPMCRSGEACGKWMECWAMLLRSEYTHASGRGRGMHLSFPVGMAIIPFPVPLKSQSAKLVFMVWASHSSHSKAIELIIEQIFTECPVLPGYWEYSSEQGRTGHHCSHVFGGEKASFES